MNYLLSNFFYLGTVEITDANTGDYTYTPKSNVSGEDTFTFKVNDGTVDSAEATVSITIAPVNDPPITTAYPVSTDMNAPYSGRLLASDVDGDTLTYSIESGNGDGLFSINSSTGEISLTKTTLLRRLLTCNLAKTRLLR